MKEKEKLKIYKKKKEKSIKNKYFKVKKLGEDIKA